MNICVLGKYPPIEGGVSMETYCLCRRLADRGHQIWVVTNADEVEPAYRISLSEEDKTHIEYASPNGGSVRVRNIERFSPRRMGHIPSSNPFVSRLSSVAADVIREHCCDVSLAYYLEPYGVACQLASVWTGCPYVLKHAGSDLDRLMIVPDLAGAYIETCRRAAAVITRVDLADRFLRIGVAPSRIALNLGFDLPDVFTPDGPRLDVRKQLSALDVDAAAHISEAYRRKSNPDPDVPTIGIYGKVGEGKGSFDLIEALRIVKSRGLRFNFLCMVNGAQIGRFTIALNAAGLQDETWFLPFMPHWRVPEFIRSCTAVCFLERDFPVAIHGPTVPREVLSCGICLVVSGEIAKKQQTLYGFVAGENIQLAPDPKDHEQLAETLAAVIREPSRARDIGVAGHRSLQAKITPNGFAERYENVLSQASQQNGATPSASHLCSSLAGLNGRVSTEWPFTAFSLLPLTARIIEQTAPELFGEFLGQEGGTQINPLETAVQFAAFIGRRLLERGDIAAAAPYLNDVLGIESVGLSLFRCDWSGCPPFSGPGRQGDMLQRDVWLNLRPERHRHAVIRTCRYDIPALHVAISESAALPAQVSEHPCSILLLPLANRSLRVFNISTASITLFERCDGSMTGQEVVEAFSGSRSIDAKPTGVTGQIRSALAQFHEKGALAFL